MNHSESLVNPTTSYQVTPNPWRNHSWMAKQELSQELARRSADQDRVKLIQECADLQVGWGEGSWISYTYR